MAHVPGMFAGTIGMQISAMSLTQVKKFFPNRYEAEKRRRAKKRKAKKSKKKR